MKQPIVTIDPSEHIKHLIGESDRATIILHAAMLEEIILSRLEGAMPNINSDERARLFDFEGPLGSFSNRIRIAHALGIIDRATRKRIEIIKEMRNAAAHCHAKIDFGTKEIRVAVTALFNKVISDVADWSDKELRGTFSVAVNSLAHVTTSPELTMSWENLWVNAVGVHLARQKSSRGK